ncbi:hypothetical protein ABZX40_16380 [Streptomyces sp. NPDC004610]|uniref:hypothetical protein n=1 Tax=unclassified Streptomyces TaxID=2593676 RepID=UPI0033A47A16
MTIPTPGRTALISLAALTMAAAVAAPGTTAASAAAPSGAPVLSTVATDQNRDPIGFFVQRGMSRGSFQGDLTWTGDGSYAISGYLNVNCYETARTTAWLQHGGVSQSWKDSEEVGCSGEGTSDSKVIHVTGKLTKREKLNIRLGTWQSSFPAGTWKHSTVYEADIFS